MYIKPRVRWLTAVLIGACLAAAGLAATPAARAASPAEQPGPFEVGNLLDYANSDFEGTIGNWVSDSNADLSDDTQQAYLHNDSLLDSVPPGGTSSFRLSGTPNAITIPLNPGTNGAVYRVAAYFKTSGTAGETVQFSLGCWNSQNAYLGLETGATNSLLASSAWQYSEDDITVPSDCAYVQGSPKVTLGGLPVNAAVNMDEAIFAPYRAALIIGAHGETGLDGGNTYTATDWVDTNTSIGPLQSDKELYGAQSVALPTQWDDSTNNCYEIEKQISNSADWPACVMSFADYQSSETAFQDLFAGLPAAQMVIMVFHGEPEGSSDFSSGAQYVSEFETESQYIREAAVTSSGTAMPNVFVAMDSEDYQYGNGAKDSAGTGCHYIPPPSYTDFYLTDHYDEGANGDSLPNETSTDPDDPTTTDGQKWSTWLNCVQSYNKPLGLAEYGLDCTTNPDQSVVTQEMQADDNYLAAIPGATEPTIMWESWYSDSGVSPGCVFNNSAGGITQWQDGETQNGGG
jgi:hypothetical protein